MPEKRLPIISRQGLDGRRTLAGTSAPISVSFATRPTDGSKTVQTRTFTGLGSSFSVHDNFATVSEGPIMDRTKEHLGYSDLVPIAARKLLLRAMRDACKRGTRHPAWFVTRSRTATLAWERSVRSSRPRIAWSPCGKSTCRCKGSLSWGRSSDWS